MDGKKFLFVPGNNSLSHLVKSLAVIAALRERGVTASIAVSRKHAPFLKNAGIDPHILPDIQENDQSGFPSVEWFRQPRTITACIQSEIDLLQQYSPDRVIGVFRFTLKAAAAVAGIPFDSLACGCMLPDSAEVLGFAAGEPGRERQQVTLDGFYRYAGARLGAALAPFGLPDDVGDIRRMLNGERTFLWDFPEFAPLPPRTDLIHLGPIGWDGWPYDRIDIDSLLDPGRPLAVVAFGTCTVSVPAARRIVRVLVDRGYRVILAAGGQREFLDIMATEPMVSCLLYAPLPQLFPHADLLVTHGGQLTIFEALQHRVPVVVMPFQPEQAHNGLCLERLGCGLRLVPPQPFQGDPGIFLKALERMTDGDIVARIETLVADPQTARRLDDARRTMAAYGGAAAMADVLLEH